MDEINEDMLEYLKDIKRDVGSVLPDIEIDKMKQRLIALTDDDLLRHIGVSFGKFVMHVKSTNDVMAAYGVAIAYFLAEEEAKIRNLYP